MDTNPQLSAPQTNSWDLSDAENPIIEEIHERRSEYAERFGYDLERMFRDIKAREATNPAPRADIRPLEPFEAIAPVQPWC